VQFQREGETPDALRVLLVNGEERAELDPVYKKQTRSSIPVTIYDALLIGRVQGDSLYGYFRRINPANRAYRFMQRAIRISGLASQMMVLQKGSMENGPSPSSVRKTVKHPHVIPWDCWNKKAQSYGTILTTTGDYRYLEGVIDGTQLNCSAFSGRVQHFYPRSSPIACTSPVNSFLLPAEPSCSH